MLGDDEVTNRRPEELARRGVGYVPQVQDIFEPLSVLENLEMGGYLLPTAAIRARVHGCAEVFPALTPMLKRRADKLSGGERKMLAIARVLMLDPKVLILDEPTANLAPQLADTLLREQVERAWARWAKRCCWSSSALAPRWRSRRTRRFWSLDPFAWKAGPANSSIARISRNCFWEPRRVSAQRPARRRTRYEAAHVWRW